MKKPFMSFTTHLYHHVVESRVPRFVLALAVVAGLAGCAGAGMMATPSCGTVSSATDLPITISAVTPNPYVKNFTVAWTAAASCKLTDGTLNVYLVDPITKVACYCGTGTMHAQGPTDPNSQVVSVSFPLGTKKYKNTFNVQRSVVATFSDGFKSTWSNTNYTSMDCP